MALVELNIFPRQETGKNANRRTRVGGRIPAVWYGKGIETKTVEVDAVEFQKGVTGVAGGSVLFSLKDATSGSEAIALLREVQRHPVTDMVFHIDLFEIPPDKPITAPVRVQIQGESLDVKRGDAILSLALDAVEVSCLPRELPNFLPVDISELQLGDKLYAKDIQVPAGGTIVTDPETLILLLNAPAVFLEVEEAPAEGEAEEAAEMEEGEGAPEAESGGGSGEKNEK